MNYQYILETKKDKNLRIRMSLTDLVKPENAKKLNDFLKAWKIIQSLPPENPNSFWAIASYHGMPFKKNTNSNSTKKAWGGYCQHGNVLFPTWHRLYLLKMEHALQAAVPDGDIALHYWDETSRESLINGLPDILTREKVEIDGELVSNPLHSFVLNKEIDGPPDSFYKKPINYKTQRYPFSGIVNPKDAAEIASRHNSMFNNKNDSNLLNNNIVSWLNNGKPRTNKGNSILNSILKCLEEADYNTFSNTSSASLNGKNGYSLEQPHNDMHLAIGGFTNPKLDADGNVISDGIIPGSNGDMGENETASFDPVFYFHHSFIDRVFWLWQLKWDHCTVETSFEIMQENSNDVNPSGTSTHNQGPTPHQTFDEHLTMDTVLYPFQDFMGVPYTSRDCVDIRKQLGYTYANGSLEKSKLFRPLIFKSPPMVRVFDKNSLHELRLFMNSPVVSSIGLQQRKCHIDLEEVDKSEHNWKSLDFINSKKFKFGSTEWKRKVYLRVSNINLNNYPGSFVVRTYYKKNNKFIFVGQKGVLGRWNRSNCSNCQVHQFICIQILLDMALCDLPLDLKDFRTEIISKNPSSGHYKTFVCNDTNTSLTSNQENPKRQLMLLYEEISEQQNICVSS